MGSLCRADGRLRERCQLQDVRVSYAETDRNLAERGIYPVACPHNGADFGDQVEAVKVFFGGVEADSVLMCKNNRIVVKVPDAAVTGAVSLEVWGKSVDSVATFTVLPTPTIVSVRSDNGLGEGVAAAGDLVTITGTNFGTDASVISVSFNGTSADFELVDEEHIVATAPAGYASGSVYVTINRMRLTGDAMMNPESKGDVTIFYLENYARPFQQIPYISGQEGDRNMAVRKGGLSMMRPSRS